ncbi:MAG: hypothetical protein IK105_00465 [Thermoguttaceae bacterium]|nr:hypothetical protein [Thermoguttaceae bacterium]
MKKRTLRFESLEERQLLAVTAGLASLAFPAPVSAEPAGIKVGDVYVTSTADADGDGFIGPAELSYMSYAWFSTDGSENWSPTSDLDGDGFIGPGDHALLSSYWFKTSDELPESTRSYEIYPSNVGNWILSGDKISKITARSGSLTLDARSGELEAVCAYDGFPDNLRVTADFCSTDSSSAICAGIEVVVQEDSRSYYAEIQNDRVCLYFVGESGEMTLLNGAFHPFAANQTYTVWLQNSDGQLSFGVGEDTLVTVSGSSLSGGKVGFRASAGVNVFSNISVETNPDAPLGVLNRVGDVFITSIFVEDGVPLDEPTATYRIYPSDIANWQLVGGDISKITAEDGLLTINANDGPQEAICDYDGFPDDILVTADFRSSDVFGEIRGGIEVAVQESGARYYAEFEFNATRLYYVSENGEMNLLATGASYFEYSRFYSVWVQLSDGLLACGIDDTTLISVYDSTLSGGMVGFYGAAGTNVFRNISVGAPVFDAIPDAYDYGDEPMRYLENSRVKLGIDLSIGGAVTWLSDTKYGGVNMINSCDWGRQIQLSYYSGPIPYIGPNGEQPNESWRNLGWNPIQSGDCYGFQSKVISFEQTGNTMTVRTIPMLWPNANLPAECIFEVVYTLTSYGFYMDATIINSRSDRTQYAARSQEMPAVYTNGSWYKLVSYLGDNPFQNEATTVLVDKNDGNGWPWLKYYCPERWSALLDSRNRGLGVYQPDSAYFAAGFFGGDSLKGVGGAKDAQTGYIAPLETMILDHNIEQTYRAYFIVGSLSEIRSRVYQLAGQTLPTLPEWTFDGDRHYWTYSGSASDSGLPIDEGLDVYFKIIPQAKIVSPETYWAAEDAPILEIDAGLCLNNAQAGEESSLTVTLTPVSPYDTIKETAGSLTDQQRAEILAQYPILPDITVQVPLRADGTRGVWSVDLSQIDGYTGAFKSMTITLPGRSGKINVYAIRLRGDD